MLPPLLLCAAAAVALLLPPGVWRLWSCGLAGWWDPEAAPPDPRVFSEAELSGYTGGPGLYLAVLGQVFDVGRGRRHYGPGGPYHFFTGRDASRAFVSGDFTEPGLVDDVSGLSPMEMLSLHEWLTFYKREYIFKAFQRDCSLWDAVGHSCISANTHCAFHICYHRKCHTYLLTSSLPTVQDSGKLAGTYYDSNGEPTQALIDAELIIEQGRKLKAESELEKKVFPPCNSEWTSSRGGRVWCSTHSGGIERNWVGVPRKLYKAGSKNYCCVCVRTDGPASYQPESAHNRGDLDNPALREYPGCHNLSDSCVVVDE